ncbi:MAG: lipoprotein insertase outer membrane protein LolB [Candidatus Berkiella sp.]
MNRFNVLFITAILLAGCTSTSEKNQQIAASTPQLEQRWKVNEKQLDGVNHWQAEGKLSVAQRKKGGSASFVWQQQGEFYQIKIFGPFGAKSAYIIGGPNHVELKEANGNVSTAKSPEALLYKVVGWQVPISGLRYWLRGIPVPNTRNGKQFNEQGLLATLKQQGWNIEYQEYNHNTFAPLPSKVVLFSDQVKVKMIVNNWKELPA